MWAVQIGIFTAPTRKSDTAKDTMKLLLNFFNGWWIEKTTTTIRLPIKVIEIMKNKLEVRKTFSQYAAPWDTVVGIVPFAMRQTFTKWSNSFIVCFLTVPLFRSFHRSNENTEKRTAFLCSSNINYSPALILVDRTIEKGWSTPRQGSDHGTAGLIHTIFFYLSWLCHSLVTILCFASKKK